MQVVSFGQVLSGPFMSYDSQSVRHRGRARGGGWSPVAEVAANTSLSAVPPQYAIHRQLSQHTLTHTHTCSYAHTCHVSMVRNDIPTYTQIHPSSCNEAKVPDRPAPTEFPGN